MKKRNLFTVLLLSIITFGIYDIYWLVKTKAVLNKETRIHTPTIWLLFAPVLLFVALIIVAMIHGNASTPYSNGSSSGAGFAVFILLFDVIAFLLIIPITFYWFFKISKAINEYTHGELNTGVTFLLLWLLHFIGVIIVQDKFNDMIDAGQVKSQPNPALATNASSPAPPTQPSAPITHTPQPVIAPAALVNQPEPPSVVSNDQQPSAPPEPPSPESDTPAHNSEEDHDHESTPNT